MLCVVIPTYNERENIIKLIGHIKNLLKDCYIIIVDDNSPDGTAEAIRSLGDASIHLIVRSKKLGLGSALRDGIKRALDIGCNRIATMDADFSHEPTYLKEMYEKSLAENVDLVIGSRYVKGSKIENWSIHRLIVSRTANLLTKILLHTKISDNTSNFRIYSRSAAEKAMECNDADGFEYQICSVFKVVKAGLIVVEYPIIFKDRKEGSSKLKISDIIRWFFYIIKLSLSS